VASLTLRKSSLCDFHIHHCLGELFNAVDASISHDSDDRKSPSKKFRGCLQCFIAVAAMTFSIPCGFQGLACTMKTISQLLLSRGGRPSGWSLSSLIVPSESCVSFRLRLEPTGSLDFVGFRCVREAVGRGVQP